MKCLSDRFVIEPAKPSDAEDLLELIEQTPFDGDIALLYTRRPNAYASFLAEGKEVEISICRDTQKDILVAMGGYAIHDLFVDGRSEPVAYIFGLKGQSDYLKKHPLLHKFYEYLQSRLKAKGIRTCYTTILKDNEDTQRLLEKERRFMPRYNFVGQYECYAIRNKPNGIEKDEWVFSRVKKEDLADVVGFLNREGQNYQFFPHVSLDDILGEQFKGICLDNFYMVKRGAEIVAAGAVWDQSDYKQYVVQQYSGALKMLKSFPWMCRVLQLPDLPDPGECLRFYTLARWVIKDNDTIIWDFFIDKLMAQKPEYPFFLIGMHERHPIRSHLSKRKHIKYASKVYLVDWEKQGESILRTDRPFYIECGAL